MTLLESLIIAHLLGDWLFQTEWMALNKSKNALAMTLHLFIYHIFILAVLFLYVGMDNTNIYIVLFLMIIIHAILDLQWTIDAIIKYLRITVKRDAEKWLKISIDQTLHILLLAGVTVYFTL